jgi:2-methylcitrate dehydratase PrpD
MARRLVLDQLGLQLRGAALPNVQPVRAVAAALGGPAEATAAGSASRLSAPQAAWVNGTLGHSAEYDDAHMSAWHTSSAVVPAALAAWAVGHGAAIVRPTDAISAQFSLAFGLGLQLVTGENRPQDYFDPARWSDPAITRIAEAVFPVAMEIPEGDPNLSASLDIELSDGRHRTAYQAGFHGHPIWPATDHDIQDKFRANLDGIATEETAQAIIDIMSALDRAPSVRDLTRLLQQVA